MKVVKLDARRMRGFGSSPTYPSKQLCCPLSGHRNLLTSEPVGQPLTRGGSMDAGGKQTLIGLSLVQHTETQLLVCVKAKLEPVDISWLQT